MSILSIEFIGLTLAAVILYYILPLKVRWCVLLAASAVFYTFAGWQGCIWITAAALLTYASSLLQHRLLQNERSIAQTEEQRLELREDQNAALPPDRESVEDRGRFQSSRKIKKLRKLVLAVTVILPFAAMALVKYYDAFRAWITSIPSLTLIVPLGLSYFTFQSVGYCVDIYRGKYEPEKNPLKYLLFISFFPQLTQGPISPYLQLMPQLVRGNRFDPDNFVMGFQLALWGYFKKMVLADRLTSITDAVNTGQQGWMILLTVIIYAVRLYADFSGGMDVIRGAAKMMGIDMVENFRRPFFSFSVAEYWRRWHISLGVWFRSYLFYPITTSGFGLWLSRVGRKLFGKKTGRGLPGAVATVIIFFLIGIWHTASVNAVIFGLYYGLLLGTALMLEPTFRKLKKKLHVREKSLPWKVFTLVRTWILILLPQYFAFTADPKTSFALLGATFRNWDLSAAGKAFRMVEKPLTWYIAAGAFVLMLTVDLICEKKPQLNRSLARGPFYVRWPLLILLILIILIYGCYGAGYDPTAFLYTHF